jgi:hypothetical protein
MRFNGLPALFSDLVECMDRTRFAALGVGVSNGR